MANICRDARDIVVLIVIISFSNFRHLHNETVLIYPPRIPKDLPFDIPISSAYI